MEWIKNSLVQFGFISIMLLVFYVNRSKESFFRIHEKLSIIQNISPNLFNLSDLLMTILNTAPCELSQAKKKL